uniref:Uncharacterized protein n=1 Tax=Timema poppense TaxID=170557 RepID=A0A7R9DFZ9_TIMPO|nr:unnamed protein product [Timema poppensis]
MLGMGVSIDGPTGVVEETIGIGCNEVDWIELAQDRDRRFVDADVDHEPRRSQVLVKRRALSLEGSLSRTLAVDGSQRSLRQSLSTVLMVFRGTLASVVNLDLQLPSLVTPPSRLTPTDRSRWLHGLRRHSRNRLDWNDDLEIGVQVPVECTEGPKEVSKVLVSELAFSQSTSGLEGSNMSTSGLEGSNMAMCNDLVLSLASNVRKMNMHMAIVLVILVLNYAGGTTLEFTAQSPDRPTSLYKAPSSYKSKPGMNSFIITSRPYGLNKQQDAILDPPTTTTSTEDPLWRRQLLVSSSLPVGEEGLPISIPQYNIECSDKEACTHGIAVSEKPTFKPYSPDILNQFLKDYQEDKEDKERTEMSMSHKQDSVSNQNNENQIDSLSSFKRKHFNIQENEESHSTNLITNLYPNEDFNAEPNEDYSNHNDTVTAEDKSKSHHWDLVPSKHHHHPYDDREGWVTLEAVPWSKSKISKWQATVSSTDHHTPPWDHTDHHTPPWDHTDRPSHHWDTRPSLDFRPSSDRPPWSGPNYHRPNSWDDKPSDWSFEKPHKPNTWTRPSEDTWSPPYKPKPSWDNLNPHKDIVTDETNRWPPVDHPEGEFRPWYEKEPQRPVYEQHPLTHPDHGHGEWVLLSSTKGFSAPQRFHNYRRALTINSQPLNATRTVRLTVFPDRNTTKSHGGMLEVQNNFDTVDQDQHKVNLKPQADAPVNTNRFPLNNNRFPTNVNRYPTINRFPNRYPTNTNRGSIRPVTLVAPLNNNRPPQSQNNRGRGAMLAAVTAGIVPATMAVLVPMMMGRRKKRNAVFSDSADLIKHTSFGLPNGDIKISLVGKSGVSTVKLNRGTKTRNGKPVKRRKSIKRRHDKYVRPRDKVMDYPRGPTIYHFI